MIGINKVRVHDVNSELPICGIRRAFSLRAPVIAVPIKPSRISQLKRSFKSIRIAWPASNISHEWYYRSSIFSSSKVWSDHGAYGRSVKPTRNTRP